MKHVVIVVLTGIYQGKFCDFHGIYIFSDLAKKNGELMGFIWDLANNNCDFMGFNADIPSAKLAVCYGTWPSNIDDVQFSKMVTFQ